ncbi:hypothetical protein, partial [Fischerella thermalis]|uniref:hypothetical protein n=1 Tax=Fischerella thermalis TaxID=372787 RepID=UPI001CA5C479
MSSGGTAHPSVARLYTDVIGSHKVERDDNKPLITHFGGVCLRWNKWVRIDDSSANNIWNGRSEVVQRLLAQKCEICGATDNIEVHHI